MKEFKGNIKDVIGYEGLYVASDIGIIYSLQGQYGIKVKELKFNINSYGYPRFSLTKEGKVKNITAHKIITSCFLGRRPPNQQVRHLDGNKLNFRLDNLCYGTAKQNAEDRDKHGKTAIGVKIASHKLTQEQVKSIRNEYKNRGDMVILAKKYDVSCANIYAIIKFISRKKG